MPITGLQLINVTGKYLKLDGTPATGTVTFLSGAVIVNTAANEIIYPTPFVATLDTNGAFAIVVPATNDPDLIPQGWTYTVVESLNVGTRTYSVELPYNLAGFTIDLADIPHAVASSGLTSALTLISSGGFVYRIKVSDDGVLSTEPA